MGALPQNHPGGFYTAFPPLCLAMDATGSAELWHQCPALLYEALPGWRLQHCTPALPADLPASQGLHLTTGNTEQWRSFLPGHSVLMLSLVPNVSLELESSPAAPAHTAGFRAPLRPILCIWDTLQEHPLESHHCRRHGGPKVQ